MKSLHCLIKTIRIQYHTLYRNCTRNNPSCFILFIFSQLFKELLEILFSRYSSYTNAVQQEISYSKIYNLLGFEKIEILPQNQICHYGFCPKTGIAKVQSMGLFFCDYWHYPLHLFQISALYYFFLVVSLFYPTIPLRLKYVC